MLCTEGLYIIEIALHDLVRVKENGDQQVWNLHEQRFPKKEAHDQMGEVLGEVFGLAAKDSESMKNWTSRRPAETFLRCRRKANVNFPTQARGWIMLHAQA